MPTVMVVEDNDDIREVVVETLRDAGYDVVEAEHGQRALELLDEGVQPGMVLLDLMMPVMGGQEFLKVLEASDRLAALPVVVVSAVGEARQVPQASRFVRKPPSQELLLQLVREFCGQAP